MGNRLLYLIRLTFVFVASRQKPALVPAVGITLKIISQSSFKQTAQPFPGGPTYYPAAHSFSHGLRAFVDCRNVAQ